MNKKYAIILGALVVLLLSFATGCVSSSSPNATPAIPPYFSQQTGIWVDGQGKVNAVPDTAIISLGVQAQAETVTEAQTQAVSTMSAIVAALKSNGIQDKDIQTQNFSISPVAESKDGSAPVVVGYMVTNTATVKIRTVASTGPVIDAAAQAGGNLTRINSISFTIDDPTALQAQAQELALQDAKTKAKAIADTMGVRLGQLTYVQVSASTPFPQPIAAVPGPLPGVATPISPGELTVQVTAQTGWAIR
ncbi:MAG: SIMPL domain-containing protein [Chloroflexota bacterium]